MKLGTIITVLKVIADRGCVSYSDVEQYFTTRSQWYRLMDRLQREGLVELHGKVWYATDKLYKLLGD